MRSVWLLLGLTLPGLAGAFAPGACFAPGLSSRAAAVCPPLHAQRCTDLTGTSPSTRRALLQGLAAIPLAVLSARPAAASPAGETVLVVGSRSYIGEYVVEELQRQGVRVRALTRDPSAQAQSAPGYFHGVYSDVDWRIGNLNQPATITAGRSHPVSRKP